MESSSSTKVKRDSTARVTADLYEGIAVVHQSTLEQSADVCYVIVSTSSLMWTTLTLIASSLISVALMTPYWLLSSSVSRPNTSTAAANRSGLVSIGVFNECTGLHKPEVIDVFDALSGDGGTSNDCRTFVSGFDMPDEVFPNAWKSAVILFTVASVLVIFTDFCALVSIRIQSIFGKSIFTVSGLLQSIAGMFI